MISRSRVPATLTTQRLAGAGLVLSGVVHLGLTPEHLREAPILGLGFLVVGLLQIGLGLLFARRLASPLWVPALLLTVFSVTVYVISRVAGLPFGHDRAPEGVAAIDLISKAAELLTGGALLAAIFHTAHGWPRGRSSRLAPFNRYAYLVVLLAAGIAIGLAVVEVGAQLSPARPHHDHEGHSMLRRPASRS